MSAAGAARPRDASPNASLVLAADEGDLPAAMAALLAAHVVKQAQGTVAAEATITLDAAAQPLRKSGLPLADALLMLTGRMPPQAAAALLERVRSEGATIDRALTLLWTYRALGSADGKLLRDAMPRLELDGPWKPVETATGRRVYAWDAAKAPATLRLAAPPVPGMTAVVNFRSREPEVSKLPVRIERRIYRMVRGDAAPATAKADPKPRRGPPAPESADSGATYTLQLLAPGAALRTDEVYLDEVVLRRTSGSPLRYGIVEVPLPPGTSADRTTWGISLRFPGTHAAEALERARYEQTPRGYAVPIDTLDADVVIRHLVRPAQTGRFTLPPARYYRMYQPDLKAFEVNARAHIDIR
jgi:hypothetical protein